VNTELNLASYFLQASPIVKATMLLLLVASVVSWTLIFQRARWLRQLNKARSQFENQFWSGIELTQLHHTLTEIPPTAESLAAIFQAGFVEFSRLRKSGCQALPVILEAVARAMHIARSQAESSLEQHLNWLATIGSSSPYVGLLGTVWGIMGAFGSLAGADQMATLALVAPGISEALAATAMGLFAAIPAVVFYNRIISQIERLLNQYAIFQEELIALLLRQAYEEKSAENATV